MLQEQRAAIAEQGIAIAQLQTEEVKRPRKRRRVLLNPEEMRHGWLKAMAPELVHPPRF